MMAINRDELIKHIVPGHGTAVKLKGICLESTYDCSYGVLPTEYNPAEAKKLLAEAGFPNGFELQLDVHEPVREIAEGIAGDLRKVGIRAAVQPMPLNVYVKRRGEGDFTMFTGFYPTSSQPDTMNLFDFFFGQDRDYYKDDIILKAQQEANLEFDDAKRRALYLAGINRVNEMNYIIPFSTLPAAYAMTKDVKIMKNRYSATAVYINDLVWDDYKGE
jgi:peptide/nickel transport system substrate-binding protein